MNQKYANMNKKELISHIHSLKKTLGKKVVIPAHHYQDYDIVQFNDFIGDSYKLAVECSKTDSEFILFCGVLFMAEGASVLSSSSQKIVLPELSAGCPMADMADLASINKAFNLISQKIDRELAPVVYMNSYADLKSFCGEKDGSVCTSSNASKIINYYLNQNKAILFFPDYFLGKNTANELGIEEKYTAKIKKDFSIECSGDINKVKMFLWDGYCPIHQKFNKNNILSLRKTYPEIKIIVHPECPEEVVNNADISGSTEKINKLVMDSPDGSIWGIGTETTFVNRIALDNPKKTILPLTDSVCKDMLKIDLKSLAASLESIQDFLDKKGELKYEIKVNDEYKKNAKKALEKMIEISEK